MIEALDREEHDLVGATVGHGKRVAYLSYLMTRSLPWSPDERLALSLLLCSTTAGLWRPFGKCGMPPERGNPSEGLFLMAGL